MITGSGRVNLLSGLDLLHGARPQIRWATTPAGWALLAARAVRLAGPRRGFGPNAEFN
jgi:hypothetical protein